MENHLTDIACCRAVAGQFRLCSKKIRQRALSAFDLTRQHGLLADIHKDEEVRVRKDLNRTIKPPHRTVRSGELNLQSATEGDGGIGRQGTRDKGPVSGRLLDVGACAAVLIPLHSPLSYHMGADYRS